MDGLLIIDKPAGPTSHDVVARMRRVLEERRIGHTGTLDPAASGVLPLVIGRATRLAQFLSAHKKVQKVFYPGLPDHPQHELAKRQMKGFGGMLSFDLGSLDAARRLLNNVRLMALAESLGGVESLISHPATMTHASVPADRRAAIGITDGLVRISAGIEDIEDLQADLEQALGAV